MSFQVITARISESHTDDTVLNAALSLAQISNGHIRALYCHPDPRIVAAFAYDGIYASHYDDLVASLERDSKTHATKALKRFEAWLEKNNVLKADTPTNTASVTAEWRDVKGGAAQVIRRHGPLSDIIVTALPSKHEATFTDEGFEAAVLDTGRPVLLLPSNKKLTMRGGNILVAWNGSAEAARAVAAAMPLLRAAARVVVFTADEGRVEYDMANEAVTLLQWHGVKASIYSRSDKGATIEEEMAAAGRKTRSNLLVMGAYTHNRWRELVFGGVTKHMLGFAELPVLMMH